jgi:hypothetical protein
MRSLDEHSALIGASGFVGSLLRRQTGFAYQFRRSNIGDLDGRTFSTVVCTAAPAQKWLANREPEADRRNLDALMAHLDTIRCERFVLVSTVDVFRNPVGVDEASEVEEQGLHAYGLHRRLLEQFVARRFPGSLVARLPGLVGPGLRKNVIFDFLNGNNLHAVDSRGCFQFYPMVNLWADLQAALAAGLPLVHLTAEPVSVADVASLGFNIGFTQELGGTPARYDLRTRHAGLFGGRDGYQYSRRESLQAIRSYAQSEPVALPERSGAAP